MKTITISLGILILTVGAFAIRRTAYVEAQGTAEVDYRGEKILLTKKYVDYDDYKDDPNNLAASEIPRVEKMMTEARIGPNFSDWRDFVDQASAIKFPGYGMGSGPKVAAERRDFIVEVIDIPRVAKDRYFVLERFARRKTPARRRLCDAAQSNSILGNIVHPSRRRSPRVFRWWLQGRPRRAHWPMTPACSSTIWGRAKEPANATRGEQT